MAIIDKHGKIRGKAGPLIYRKYREKNIMQAMPRKFQQTARSILASAEFGIASSAAYVIRQAFHPGFLFSDPGVSSRMTALLRKSIANSPHAALGQRDLHDADLHYLQGMNFNADSKMEDVLPKMPVAEQDEAGNISVHVPPINAKSDLKLSKEWREEAFKYTLRIMLVAFDFRKEYYEHLDVADLNFTSYEDLVEQTVRLNGLCHPGCMTMISVSLIGYKFTSYKTEYIMLNSKAFSPCSIIACFASQKVNELPESAGGASFGGSGHLKYMPYAGNEVRINTREKLASLQEALSGKAVKKPAIPSFALRKKISFKKE